MSYESTLTKLSGQLRHQTAIDFANQSQQYWIIHLSEVICVKEGEDLINEAESNVRQLQLVLLPEQYITYKKLLNSKVIAEGKLFHAHTAHHYTQVLIEVERINSQENNDR